MKALIIILLLPVFTFAQSKGDKKIVVTVNYPNIYEKLKIALVKEDFIVKEDGNTDTVTTYPREFKNIPGYAIAQAEIKGNTIILSGSYGLTRLDDYKYTRTPKNYKPIIYYKGSRGWKLLMQIADKLDGKISYAN
jgi:hypothetical protein